MRVLEVQWSWALSLVCEVLLSTLIINDAYDNILFLSLTYCLYTKKEFQTHKLCDSNTWSRHVDIVYIDFILDLEYDEARGLEKKITLGRKRI